MKTCVTCGALESEEPLDLLKLGPGKPEYFCVECSFDEYERQEMRMERSEAWD